MPDVNIVTRATAGLLDRFEKDMRYDAHGTVIKVNRSDAGEELRQRGQETIPLIKDRIQALSAAAQTPVDEEVIACLKLLLSRVN